MRVRIGIGHGLAARGVAAALEVGAGVHCNRNSEAAHNSIREPVGRAVGPWRGRILLRDRILRAEQQHGQHMDP